MTALAADSEFWTELYRMQETGIFGLRGLIETEFGFNPAYPLATLRSIRHSWTEMGADPSGVCHDEDDRS